LQETLALNSPLETSSRATPGDDASGAATPAPRPAASALSASLNPRRVVELDEIFAENGLLARQIDGYRSRA
jgi:ATP-dependent DNA helicase DinG